MKSATLALATALLTLAACAPSPSEPASSPRAHKAQSPADSSRVYDEEEVQVKPRLLNSGNLSGAIQRNFPPLLRSAGIGGTVSLRAIVEKDGRTSNVQVIGSDNPDFAPAAAAVVRTMRFQPGTMRGEPARVRVSIPITFSPAS